ncbi:hypothetical protein N9L94_01900 [Robiginitalea sp.]|nr:hypothetical protein [Robiginitalea sp.]
MKYSETGYRIRANYFLALILALLPVFYLLSAQEIGRGRSELRGIVVEDTLGVSDVHVLNLSALRATITDAEGVFRIEVAQGDTLLFSAIRYKRTSLVVTAEIIEAVSILIPVEPFVNELDEVVVTPFNLSGNLDTDLDRLPPVIPVTAFSLGLPNAAARRYTQTENRLKEATSGGGIVPLNPLLNAITGRTKQLKKQLALERRYEKSLKMRQQFPDSLFVNRLGIPLDRLPDFMYFCEVDSLFHETADSRDALKIWGFLERKGKAYRDFNGLVD